jgi:hypothetical protein
VVLLYEGVGDVMDSLSTQKHASANDMRAILRGATIRMTITARRCKPALRFTEIVMQAPEALVIDLLTSLEAGPRPYDEVMEAWRTNCPRLPVWEDVVDHGFVQRERNLVVLTEAGREWLSAWS